MEDKKLSDFEIMARGFELQNKFIEISGGYHVISIVGAIGTLFCEVVRPLGPDEKRGLFDLMNKAISETINE